jgi:predicted 2-oxoglutarate/Fe(II)-dependent dioxygenase YbiX
MGSHIDSYGDDRSPILSVVLYLNDNYEGGELYFKNQHVIIKPTAGSIVIFPSVEPYYHESREIQRGTKYMSPGFWYKN